MSFTSGWRTNFVKAKEEAKNNHKYILLTFTGSDWCLPCMRTKQKIFDSKAFNTFADTNLVLVNADFPRQKKNKLSAEQAKENDALAEQYDKEGMFPMIILFDENGKKIKEWTGYPGVSPEKFIAQIKSLEHN
jgi:thioredoxin-related protein